MTNWKDKFIGIPWEAHGRSLDGCDCWGLVCLIVRELKGIELPSYSFVSPEERERVADLFAQEWPYKGFEEIALPTRSGDVVLFRVAGLGSHVGVACGAGCFLHSLPDVGSVMQSFSDPRWTRRLEGAYRAG